LWWKRATWIVVMAGINIAMPDDRFIFNYISPFILGVVAYYLMIKRLSKWEVLPYILIAFWLMMQYFGRDWAIAAFFAFFFIYFINGVNRWLDRLGEISYSLYLTHGLSGGSIIYLLMEHYHEVWQRLIILFIGIAGSILFAWIFYRIVELPAKRWASRV
jgi:peptidoglycan/LPS O-acetylase OafA/YrhL